MTDFYKILQVDPAADEEVIRAAYQRIISKFHPDKNPSADAEERSQAINEAYRVLSDPVQRAQYDRERPAVSPSGDLRREAELRRREMHKREEAEEALRLVQEEADAVRRQAREAGQATQAALENAQLKLQEEQHRRQEAEARLAALEKAEALRRGFGLGRAGHQALRWGLAGGGLLAVAAVFLFKFMPQAASGVQAVEPEWVFVKGGCFEMGSPDNEPERTRFESPRHQVCFKGFRLGKYEVTFDEYDRYARATGRALPEDNGWGRGHRPVINVSWDDANAYAEWLGQQTGKHYRLPTEAEWEYAARAGLDTAFPTGECLNTGQANYDGRADYFYCGAKTGAFLGRTQAVGGYPANAWGLHDMLGNAAEWTADCWHDNYQGAPSHGTAWEVANDCGARVVRGGGWGDEPARLRSAYRGRWGVAYRYADLGFRLVQD